MNTLIPFTWIPIAIILPPAGCPATTQWPPTSDRLSHRLASAATELAATQPSVLDTQSQPYGTVQLKYSVVAHDLQKLLSFLEADPQYLPP